MAGGKVWLASKGAARSTAKSSTNLVYKKPYNKKNKKKAKVAQSYRIAFNKLTPSKEVRKEFANHTLETQTSVASRTAFLILDQISQGALLNERLQSNIHMSYVHVHGTLQSNSTTKSKAFRLMLVREVNNGGIVTGTFANMWKGSGTTTYAPTGTQDDVQWPVNREIAHRVFDKTYIIKPEHDGITKINHKIRINKVCKYCPNDSTSVQPYHGRLFLIGFYADCDNNPSATTAILNCGVRVFFKDYYKAR